MLCWHRLMVFHFFHEFFRELVFLPAFMIFVTMTGCTLNAPDTPQPEPPTSIPAAPTAPFADAAGVVAGICFEAAQDAAGQVFVLRNLDDLNGLYAAADNSQLCRRPVTRQTFDFSDGRVIVGVWSYGVGCTAAHEVIAFERDTAQQRIMLELAFITQGDCPYELIRPFWIALDQAQDFDITLQMK